MSIIDFSIVPGETLSIKLLNYIESNADLEKSRHITDPIVLPVVHQRGETCKLVALENSIAHAAHKAKSYYLPLYKDKTHSRSLRQIAKEFGSIVGEVYSLEALVRICETAGYKSETFAPLDEEAYISQLEQLVDKNLAPIVFFDVDVNPGPNIGSPQIADGKNEHATNIVAYYKDHLNKTHFIVTQWENYFDIDGMELARSSFNSLVAKREIEKFVKVLTPSGSTLWELKEFANEFGEIMEDIAERTSLPMTDADTPLRGKILVVTGPNLTHESHLFFRTYEPRRATETSCDKTLRYEF